MYCRRLCSDYTRLWMLHKCYAMKSHCCIITCPLPTLNWRRYLQRTAFGIINNNSLISSWTLFILLFHACIHWRYFEIEKSKFKILILILTQSWVPSNWDHSSRDFLTGQHGKQNALFTLMTSWTWAGWNHTDQPVTCSSSSNSSLLLTIPNI